MRSLLSILLFVVLASFSTEVLTSVSLDHWLDARESMEEEKRELQELSVEAGTLDKITAAGGTPAVDSFFKLSDLHGQWNAPQTQLPFGLQGMYLVLFFKTNCRAVFGNRINRSLPLFKCYQAYIFYG